MTHIPVIVTASGKTVTPYMVEDRPLDPRDIARVLAHTCVAGGHVHRYVSLAQVSVVLAYQVPRPMAGYALLWYAPFAFGAGGRFDAVGHPYFVNPDRQLVDGWQLGRDVYRAVCLKLLGAAPEAYEMSIVTAAHDRVEATLHRDVFPDHPAGCGCGPLKGDPLMTRINPDPIPDAYASWMTAWHDAKPKPTTAAEEPAAA